MTEYKNRNMSTAKPENSARTLSAQTLFVETGTASERDVKSQLRYLAKLRRCLAQYDIVHILHRSETDISLKLPMAVMLARFYGRKVILSYLGVDIESELERRAIFFRYWVSKADRVIATSEYHCQLLAQNGIESDLIPHTVDTDLFKPKTVSQLQPKIIAARSLERRNNIGCLIKAFKAVKQKYPRAELVVVGEGSQRRQLEAYVERERIYGVTYTGRISDEQLAGKFAEADLYLNSSSLDNIPRSMLEAMTVGLPVVSTDSGGIGSVVNDGVNGLLVPINDHSGLADKIITLIEKPQLAQAISEQAKKSVAKYALAEIRKRWQKLYDQVVGESVVGESVVGDSRRLEHDFPGADRI